MQINNHKNTFCLLFIILLLNSIVLLSLFFRSSDESPICESLQLQVEPNLEAGFKKIVSSIDGKSCTSIFYHNVSEVSALVNGKYSPLEDAIADNIISHEDLYAQALLDANNEECKVLYSSELGLSEFKYIYNEYILIIRHDIFEAPDGCQYLLKDLIITCPQSPGHLNLGYSYTDETGREISLLTEDWGLYFELDKVDAYGAVLKCTQANGQHFGNLRITEYDILNENYKYLDSSQEQDNLSVLPCKIELNTQSAIPLVWESRYDQLPSGKYIISLTVEDEYEEQHQFTRNYTDRQRYYIQFLVP